MRFIVAISAMYLTVCLAFTGCAIVPDKTPEGDKSGKNDIAITRTAEPVLDDEGESGTTGGEDATESGYALWPFPFAFTAQDLDGNDVTEADLGEKEIFFVHLWATWCGPCVQEIPDLAEVAETYGDNVGFLGLLLDYDENLDGAKRLVEYHGVDILNVYSMSEGLDELNIMIHSGYVPTTIIIDGNGEIIGEQIIGSKGKGYSRLIDDALASVRGE